MIENNSFFIGNLCKDAEPKQTRDGKKFLSYSLAVNSKYKGNTQTTYVECTQWGEHCDAILPYMTKGTQIAVSGRISCHAYMDRNNQPVGALDLMVNEIKLLGGKPAAQQNNVASQNYNPF